LSNNLLITNNHRASTLPVQHAGPIYSIVCRETCRFFAVSLMMTVTIASTYCVYPWMNGQAELAWVAWLGLTVRPADDHPYQY